MIKVSPSTCHGSSLGQTISHAAVQEVLDFDRTAARGSYAFSAYKRKMLKEEDLILQSVKIMLQSHENLTLDSAIYAIENAAAPNPFNE